MHPDLPDWRAVQEEFWPHVRLYDKQEEIADSVEESAETYVVAGNKLGKDYVTGFICTCLALRCYLANVSFRIVTTSVAEHHLKVLWGEIGRHVSECKLPLLANVDNEGAATNHPFIMNYLEIRKSSEAKVKNPLSYLVGRVSERGEGLAGHHAEVTLAVGDEASGCAEEAYKMFQGWAKRMLFIGNPNPTENFFKRGVKAGDLRAV